MLINNFRALIIGILIILIAACDRNNQSLHGYIDVNLTYISSQHAGKLTTLNVERGQSIKTGDHLFTLENMPESAELKSAIEQMNVAASQLANLQKGKRPSELAEIAAQIEGAQSNITYFQKEYKRRQTLVLKSAIEEEARDKSLQNLQDSTAQLKALQQSLITAKLPARIDEIKAAEHQLASARALVEKANWALNDKKVNAPVAAEVFDTYFRIGENVKANTPILSLLVPSEVKVVFFVPEPLLSQIKLDQKVSLTCDNCIDKTTATIRFISPIAEFTPPVIYSQSARSKLVYRVEGSIDNLDLRKIHPGQPVDIKLNMSPSS